MSGFFWLLFIFLFSNAAASTDIPDGSEDLMRSATRAYEQGLYSTAVNYYQKMLEKNEEKDQAYYGEGLVCMKLGLWPKAEEGFQRSLALDPANPKAWLGLGFAQQKQGHRAEAAESFRKLFQLRSTSRDRAIAGRHLAQLGQDVPVTVPAKTFDAGWKPQLTLSAGGGYDDDLNRAPAAGLIPGSPIALNDGLTDLAADLRLKSRLDLMSGLGLEASYEYKSYWTDSAFDDHDVTGSAVYDRALFDWLKGEAGLQGEFFDQPQGIEFYSGSLSVALKGRADSLRLTASYSFNLEQYESFIVPFNPEIAALGSPSNTDSKVEVRAYETLLPWLVLNGEYQFKSNNADSLGYQYTLNGFGGGFELFFFEKERLLSALQLNYLHQSSQCPNRLSLFDQNGFVTAAQQNNVDIFTAHLEVPLGTGWSADAFCRYVNDQSSFYFFSYVDRSAGFSLSYDVF